MGNISAFQATDIAHLAMLDGCQSADILALARCGNFGQNKGSASRDLVRLACQKLKLCEAMPITVDVLDPNSRKTTQEEAAVFLPHLVFSNLAEHYHQAFESLFCFADSQIFWKNVEHLKDPRLVPPIALDKRVTTPMVTAPVFLHGDGAEYQSRDSLMTWSWGPLLSNDSSLASHLLLVSFPKSCTVPTTWGPLNDWIAWSFDALVKGKHPTTDPYGTALAASSLLKGSTLVKSMVENAGKPLTSGGHRAVLWAIQGDLEFFSNVLKLGHWSNQFPCHQCDAQKPIHKKIACPPGKSVKLLKEEDQKYQYVTPAQAMLHKKSNHPLFSVKGVSSASVRGDSLHILYCRGVASHVAGSLLHYLCFFDGLGKRQKVNPNARLQTMFGRIKELYQEKQTPSRLTNLRLSMICDTSKPHARFACLESKAAECKHLLPCLLDLLAEILPEDDPIHQTMKICLGALVDIGDHYDSCGIFLSTDEYAKGCSLAKRFFNSYHELHQWALLKGRKIFHVTWKFHTFHHLILDSKYLNYRCHHNYKPEHFVGQMSTLTHSCSFGVKASKLSFKLCSKYRLLLHLQLCRPGFGNLGDFQDP